MRQSRWVHTVQRLWHLIARVESVEVRKGFALPLKFRIADSDLVGVFSTWHILIV